MRSWKAVLRCMTLHHTLRYLHTMVVMSKAMNPGTFQYDILHTDKHNLWVLKETNSEPVSL